MQVHYFASTGCKVAQNCVRQPACKAATQPQTADPATSSSEVPLMLRAVRGDKVDRPPVWMMRQAGRYMRVYRELCQKHITFRERSENADLSMEISMQPFHAFKPDGVILFSDILTPLTGMGINFDIVQGKGPIIEDPIRTSGQVDNIKSLDPTEATPYVGEVLSMLRDEVRGKAAVLGFAGCPFTLASYIVEGGSTKHFSVIKKMAFSNPFLLQTLLNRLCDNIITYMRYQADTGAEVIQIFDSWASSLSPQDFDTFSRPYIERMISQMKKSHPHLPIILYISNSGGLIERMAACKPDVVSIDGSVDLADAIKRCGPNVAVQGNIDPGVLFGSQDFITQRIKQTVQSARDTNTRHILNLGHGVLPRTPEENVAHYFKVGTNINEYM